MRRLVGPAFTLGRHNSLARGQQSSRVSKSLAAAASGKPQAFDPQAITIDFLNVRPVIEEGTSSADDALHNNATPRAPQGLSLGSFTPIRLAARDLEPDDIGA